MKAINKMKANNSPLICTQYIILHHKLWLDALREIQCTYIFPFSFIHLFYIPLIFTDVELVIYIVSIVD
jgi:hypothetical protein